GRRRKPSRPGNTAALELAARWRRGDAGRIPSGAPGTHSRSRRASGIRRPAVHGGGDGCAAHRQDSCGAGERSSGVCRLRTDLCEVRQITDSVTYNERFVKPSRARSSKFDHNRKSMSDSDRDEKGRMPAQTEIEKWSGEEFERRVFESKPRVAIFDCDGTLWGGDAGYGFMAWSLEQGLVSRSTSDWVDTRYRGYLAGEVSELAICGEMVQIYAGLR